MTTITEVFRAHGPEYLELHPDLPETHRNVIDAIINCRSGEYGVSVYQCGDCGQIHTVNRSCGNRHCPQCQYDKTQNWLKTQIERQLPGPHFLITFTVPEQLRDFIRSHQRVCYEVLFQSSSQALKLLAADERFIGTDLPGFTGILHTWGRQLPFHPHIHYIVTGGGLSKDRCAWLPSNAHFYAPVKALSPIYRAKFKDEMRKAGLLDSIDPVVWEMDWIVNSQAVGDGSSSLKYLAPYVFRVAISNSRIVEVKDHCVTFKYRKHGSSRYRTITLDAIEFVRRFLQHVLPPGFMKVRHYGFMNPNCAVPPDAIRRMIADRIGAILPSSDKESSPVHHGPYCPHCGGALAYVKSILPVKHDIWDSA